VGVREECVKGKMLKRIKRIKRLKAYSSLTLTAFELLGEVSDFAEISTFPLFVGLKNQCQTVSDGM
jgi:hypothetical protein